MSTNLNVKLPNMTLTLKKNYWQRGITDHSDYFGQNYQVFKHKLFTLFSSFHQTQFIT